MKRVQKIITCITMACLLGCGSEAEAEPPTPKPETEVIVEEVTLIPTIEPTITPGVRHNSEDELSYAIEAMSKVWNIEYGGLVDGATEEMRRDALAIAQALHDCEAKTDLYKMAVAARRELIQKEIAFAEQSRKQAEEEERRNNARLYGVCRITFYTHTGKNTASGVYPTAGHTAANNTLPFGTRILVDGYEYIIEDRGDTGMGETGIDIFCDTEAECVNRGLYYTEVYIID